jgi:hypothetical protein
VRAYTVDMVQLHMIGMAILNPFLRCPLCAAGPPLLLPPLIWFESESTGQSILNLLLLCPYASDAGPPLLPLLSPRW